MLILDDPDRKNTALKPPEGESTLALMVSLHPELSPQHRARQQAQSSTRFSIASIAARNDGRSSMTTDFTIRGDTW